MFLDLQPAKTIKNLIQTHNINKLRLVSTLQLNGEYSLSFGNMTRVFSGVQEILVLALMMISVFALTYVEMDITYKIGIAVLAFTIIFLATLATQILRQQKAALKKASA